MCKLNKFLTELSANDTMMEGYYLFRFLVFEEIRKISILFGRKLLIWSCACLNSFGAKFQMTFVVCFFILTNYRLERHLYVKLKD